MYREKIVIGEGTDYPLNGILTLPDGNEGPVPAVVMVHGSGSSNMDEKVMKLRPFRDLAEGLARHGIASIRYDKRSFVHARKMLKQCITVKEETIEDAVLAINLLKSDRRIDSDNIYILGHSMGAMLSGRIDAEGGDFRGLIMMAGSLYSLDQILLRQLREQQETGGFLARLVLGKLIGKFEKQFTAMKTMSDEEAKKTKIGNGATLYYFKEMADHPASDYLRDNPKPMLILSNMLFNSLKMLISVGILIILMLGILHTGIAYCYYFDGMARLPLTTYAVLGYFEPVVSVLCSVFLLHEKMTMGGLCGTVMIIAAALMSELLTNAQGPSAGEEAV